MLGPLVSVGGFPIEKKTLPRTIQWTFLPNLVSIGQKLAEKKIEIYLMSMTPMTDTKWFQ
jgi:hypothetical protein